MSIYRMNVNSSIRNHHIFLILVSLITLSAIGQRASAALASTPSSGGIYFYLDPMEPFCFRMEQLPDKEPVILVKDQERLVRQGDDFILQNSVRRGEMRKAEWVDTLKLSLSSALPGDFDLLANYQPKLDGNGSVIGVEMIPLPRRVPSYIHRMADSRVMQYFGLSLRRYKNKPPTNQFAGSHPGDADTSVSLALLNLSKSMIADNPTDPYTEVFYMDALASARDAKALREELQEWDSRFEKQPMLRAMKRRLETAVQAIELSAAGRNAYDLCVAMNERDKDYKNRYKMYSSILNYDGYACPYSVLSISYPSYLESQVNVKVFETGSIMFLLEGQRQKALDLSAADYRFGQLMSQNDTLINRLVGIAIRGIAARGLGLYFLNACEKSEDVQSAWPKLEQLNNLEKPQTARQMFWLEPASSYVDEKEWEQYALLSIYIQDAMTRQSVADARFQLVRMDASAWYVFLKTGRFPAAAGQFELLPNGLAPKDPFGDAALRFKEDDSGLACYSLGPDLKDDQASINYDPTNGAISVGDIITQVPRERKYPLPRDGVKATDKADILRQFPNGLPEDSFADKKGTPLGVTNTSPVYVYSFGPDTNQSTAKPLGDAYFPDALYDPTNGTVSKGDLVCVIPKP